MPSPNPARRLPAVPAGAVAALALAALFTALASWTWGKNHHLYVDYGRELYVPWRLSAGDVLFRDIAWFNGPLSAYLNALVFAVCGPSLHAQAWCNLLLIAGVTWLIWHLLRRVVPPLAATAGCAAWLVASAFQNLDLSGNFNWVAPYSHEITHGMALALAALALLCRALERRSAGAAALCGLALGWCALTKAEVALAAGVAIAFAFVADCLGARDSAEPRRARGRRAALAGASALLPAVVATVLLATAMPLADAVRGTLGSFYHLPNTALRGLSYYQWCTGTNAPGTALTTVFVWAIAHAGTWLPVAALAVGLGTGRRARAAQVALGAFLLLLAVTNGALGGIPITLLQPYAALGALGGALLVPRLWPTAPRALPALAAAAVMLSLPWRQIMAEQVTRPLGLYALVVAGALGVAWWRQRRDGPAQARSLGTLACAVFAVLALAKICLHVRVSHYGFALALPALLMATATLAHAVPVGVAALGGRADVMRAGALGLLAVLAMAHLHTYHRHLHSGAQNVPTKTTPFATGSDAFLARTEAITTLWQRMAQWLEQNTTPDTTVAILPEGIMLNYLTRRVNPTRHVNFMPPELLMFSEDEVIADFTRKPPDVVVLVHRPSVEYGLPLFGADYGQRLLQHVRERYTQVQLIGNEPLRQLSHFGAAILRRKG